ncbi:hypothetical protein C1645_819379 [Glomus cerebriforme]|uniref:Uncharacterized protein n=1 Tax=Glomus cerebriforme TaxID=658196 RepID=A0A397T7X5_9GLOM|nr:hypothetical protein C1645_819379 [Glomus cerebriforme]
MPPLSSLLTQYIVRIDIKVNKSNTKTFCKLYIKVLEEEEGQKKQEKVFAILQPNNDIPNLTLQKRSFLECISSQASLSSSSSYKINNPKAIELFKFLNPLIKLPDHHILGSDILKQTQLLGTVLLAFDEKPYVWKAVDINIKHENYTAVIDKTEIMLTELRKIEVTVCVVVTDSILAYAAVWYGNYL